MLPLSNEELFESLAVLSADANPDVRAATAETLASIDPATFSHLAADDQTPADLLEFICQWPRAPREMVEAIIFNPSTPDAALAQLAASSSDSKIIEAISLKQQSLIRTPDIIDAIMGNSARTADAERRVREVREEFFEKRFGVDMIADEQRVQAEAARVAERTERETVSVGGIDDLIRLGLLEDGVDDALISEYDEQYGPFEASPPAPNEQLDIERVVGEVVDESLEIGVDRIPVFQRIALMSVKDRVMLAIKGTREARMILIRDPNKIVAGAVLRNPRLTDGEIEYMASVKTVPEDVLRQIGQSRAWTRAYGVIHNLVRNARTPIATALPFLNRIQTRDLRALSLNRNVPDVIRQSSYRLYLKRSGT
jgi:hypothetical protein